MTKVANLESLALPDNWVVFAKRIVEDAKSNFVLFHFQSRNKKGVLSKPTIVVREYRRRRVGWELWGAGSGGVPAQVGFAIGEAIGKIEGGIDAEPVSPKALLEDVVELKKPAELTAIHAIPISKSRVALVVQSRSGRKRPELQWAVYKRESGVGWRPDGEQTLSESAAFSVGAALRAMQDKV